ncbi:universal stress protein [Nocardioidaceae bacterium]|nr:universal stress protein [Nocardioidaceae bacterium]
MTVLVAHLPTRESTAALHAGAEEARRREEDLVVFDLGDGTGRAAGESLVRESGVRVVVEQRDPRQPDAAGALLDAATRHDASVIVIGVRHRSPTGKLLFGSLAQQILLDATMPVLAVKP